MANAPDPPLGLEEDRPTDPGPPTPRQVLAQLRERRELRTLILWTAVVALVVVALELGFYSRSGQPWLLNAAGLLSLFAVAVLVSLRVLRRGKLRVARNLTLVGMMLTALLYVWIMPALYPVLVMVPILVGVAALTSSKTRHNWVAVAGLCGLAALMAIVGIHQSGPQELMDPAVQAVTVVGITSVVGLTSLAMLQHHARLVDSMTALSSSIDELWGARAQLERRLAQINSFKIALELEVAQRTAELQERTRQLEGTVAALDRSEARLKRVHEAVPVGILTVDSAGFIIDVNHTGARMFGYKPDELTGVGLFRLLPDLDREALASAVAENESERTQVGAARELAGRRRDGQVLPVEVAVAPMHTRFGAQIIAAVRDMSERHAAESAIREHQDRLNALMRYASAMIWVKGQDRRYLLCNELFLDVHGLDESAVVGSTDEDLGLSLQQAPGQPLDEAVLSSGGVLESEDQTGRGEGARTWLTTRFPLRDPAGEVYAVGAVSSDVTELKRAQEDLSRLALSLSEANEDLVRSNRELDQFAYIASHDLRAPLRAIDNLAKWIDEDAGHHLPKDSSADLQLLRARVARMDRLLEDLLIFSRVGRLDREVTRIDIAELAQEVWELLVPPPGFKLSLPRRMPIIWSRRTPLRQVLLNLVGNAIKHHDRDHGVIEIRARPIANGVELSLRDDGPGIEPRFHDRVFELFQTLKPRDEVEASGMGLAVVRKVVDTNGGAIWIDSEQRGCTMRWTWPAELDREPSTPDAPAVRSAKAATSRAPRSES